MTNQIIQLMSIKDRSRLERHLETVVLPDALTIGGLDAASSHTYFPISGVASIMARTSGKLRLNVGMFGHEGMSDPWEPLTTSRSSFDTVMLTHGHGYRVATHIVSEIVRDSDEFRFLLSRYAHTLALQFASTAIAGGCLSIEKRLARWMLMVSDRTIDDTFEVTHETIAEELRVRRQSVTTALKLLAGMGLVRGGRRSVKIVSREHLTAFCKGGYGLPEAEYSRIFPESNFPAHACGSII